MFLWFLCCLQWVYLWWLHLLLSFLPLLFSRKSRTFPRLIALLSRKSIASIPPKRCISSCLFLFQQFLLLLQKVFETNAILGFCRLFLWSIPTNAKSLLFWPAHNIWLNRAILWVVYRHWTILRWPRSADRIVRNLQSLQIQRIDLFGRIRHFYL